MGKHKSKRKPVKKSGPPPLDTTFNCPFCNYEKAVTCKLDKKNKTGTLSCRVCKEKYTTEINALSEEIDVYSLWIDDCEKVNRNQTED